jgi:hypothetical protein
MRSLRRVKAWALGGVIGQFLQSLADHRHRDRVAPLGVEGILADLVDESGDAIIDPDFPRHFYVLEHHLRSQGNLVPLNKHNF